MLKVMNRTEKSVEF